MMEKVHDVRESPAMKCLTVDTLPVLSFLKVSASARCG